MLKSILSPRMLLVLLMGFSSGLPLLLVGSTLKAWMTESKVSLATIGIFSLVGTPYTLKFLWSPLMDRFTPPFLGRRRGWLLITQVALAVGLVAMSTVDPAGGPARVAALAVFIAFASASQDIVIDAFRREYLSDDELGLGSSMTVNGYRIGMWAAGAGGLAIAALASWPTAYLCMAGAMGIGMLATFLAPEPSGDVKPPESLRSAVVEPFLEYFRRPGALWILGFVLLYKIGDQLASEMTMPFYLQLGFEKIAIAGVVKTFGIWATILGGFVGGVILLKLGIARSLFAFGVLQALSTVGFSLLHATGPNLSVLAGVIAFENLTGGMGTSAYVAFMGSLCNRRFTATQYALLSSVMGIPRAILAAPTGYLAQSIGWTPYFLFCAVIAVPGLLILARVAGWAAPAREARAT